MPDCNIMTVENIKLDENIKSDGSIMPDESTKLDDNTMPDESVGLSFSDLGLFTLFQDRAEN